MKKLLLLPQRNIPSSDSVNEARRLLEDDAFVRGLVEWLFQDWDEDGCRRLPS